MGTVLDKIKAAKDLGQVSVRIDEWDADFLIIEPSRKTVLGLQEKYKLSFDTKGQVLEGADLEGFGLASLVEMVHDTDKAKVFKSAEEAAEVLNEKSAKVYAKLVEACQSFVKGPDAEKTEEAEKNSEGIQS